MLFGLLDERFVGKRPRTDLAKMGAVFVGKGHEEFAIAQEVVGGTAAGRCA